MTTTDLLLGLYVIFLHEAAHVAAALSLGINVKRIGVSWKGAYIVREAGPPVVNIMITLAGPFANLLVAGAWPEYHRFAMINLIFGISNLLPIAGSDGQRAWAEWAKVCRARAVPTRSAAML